MREWSSLRFFQRPYAQLTSRSLDGSWQRLLGLPSWLLDWLFDDSSQIRRQGNPVDYQTHILRQRTFFFSSLFLAITVEQWQFHFQGQVRKSLISRFSSVCKNDIPMLIQELIVKLYLVEEGLYCYIIIYQKVTYVFLFNWFNQWKKLQKWPEWDTKAKIYPMLWKCIPIMSFIEIQSTMKFSWNELGIFKNYDT